MNEKDRDAYINKYVKRLDEFGDDPSTLGWGGGVERQKHRFDVLREVGIGASDSVLDIGCGFADMYELLTEKGWSGEYLGIDLNQKLLEVAEQKYEGVKTLCADILDNKELDLNYDWTVASGVFNARMKHEDHMKYVTAMLEKMWSFSNKGMAFDFMSTYVDFEHPDAFHMEPGEAIRLAKQLAGNTGRVVLRMDYLPYEFCVYVYKA